MLTQQHFIIMGTPTALVSCALFLSLRLAQVFSLIRPRNAIPEVSRTDRELKEESLSKQGNVIERSLSDSTIPPKEICDLECLNGGNCEIITQSLDHNNAVPKVCVCPPGYGGLSCQIKTEMCFVYLNQDRYCRNAAPCVTRGGAHCQCDHAHDIGAFAGIECEYPATEYCTDDGSISWTAFCTNGGACDGYIRNLTEP